jgi:hypothetical protein
LKKYRGWSLIFLGPFQIIGSSEFLFEIIEKSVGNKPRFVFSEELKKLLRSKKIFLLCFENLFNEFHFGSVDFLKRSNDKSDSISL